MNVFKYQDKGTAIHRLNPFNKLVWLGAIFTLVLIFNNPLYLMLLFLATLPMVAAAKVWREWASFMKFTLYLCLAVIIINALVSSHGTHVLWQAHFDLPVVGTPQITLEAILCGVGNSVRLFAIISAFALFTLTVHPDDMMLAMIKVKLPYKSALVTSLCTRFVPTLIDDMERITDVQRSRGLELDKGGLAQKARGRMRVIIPLLSNSLDRTVQVAEAMESRAFGTGKGRSFYKDIAMHKLDIAMLMCGISPLVLGAVMRCHGWGDYQYYPTIESVGFNGPEISLLILLLFLLSMTLFLALVNERVSLD